MQNVDELNNRKVYDEYMGDILLINTFICNDESYIFHLPSEDLPSIV